MVVKDGNMKINIKTSNNRQTGQEIKLLRFVLSLGILPLKNLLLISFLKH